MDLVRRYYGQDVPLHQAVHVGLDRQQLFHLIPRLAVLSIGGLFFRHRALLARFSNPRFPAGPLFLLIVVQII